MCGIGGYVGSGADSRDVEVLHQTFKSLATRGTDGFGYLVAKKDHREVYKDSQSIRTQNLSELPSMLGAEIVLLHTRASTSGENVPRDCHPLAHKDVIIVHNGTVANHALKRRQYKLDTPKYPQVDSFLIAYLIGESPTILDGIRRVYKELTGSLTFVVYSPRAPYNIWTVNLHGQLQHIKYRGQNYICSTEYALSDGLSRYVKGYIVRDRYSVRPLYGVHEISRNTVKEVISRQELNDLDSSKFLNVDKTLSVEQSRSFTLPVQVFPKPAGKLHQPGTMLLTEAVKYANNSSDNELIQEIKRDLDKNKLPRSLLRTIVPLLRSGSIDLIAMDAACEVCGSSGHLWWESAILCWSCFASLNPKE